MQKSSLQTLILFLLLVLPGSAVVVVSTYWGINDFSALVEANQRFNKLATERPKGSHDYAYIGHQTDLFIMAHRENTHRINVGFDGTWILLGGILAGIGIQGIVRGEK